MINVFESFLRKELGSSKYIAYLGQYKKMEPKCEKKMLAEISQDIYEGLKDKDVSILLQIQKHLKDAILLVLRLSRHYVFTVISYFLAVGVILLIGKIGYVNIVTTIMLTIAFFYKTYEFLINKYSYLDAYMILAYKTALEKRIHELKSQ